MSKDPFKTRLEIAKKKVSKRDLENKKDNQSPIGTAFKLSTELVSAVAVGTIIDAVCTSNTLVINKNLAILGSMYSVGWTIGHTMRVFTVSTRGWHMQSIERWSSFPIQS